MATYADYGYYTTSFLGTSISEQDFPRLALRASNYIDYITINKAQEYAENDPIKMACCAIAEQYQQIETAQQLAQKSLKMALTAEDSGEVQSESVGNWSKSYRSGGDSAAQALSATQAASSSLYAVARQYLAVTGLLYRGKRCCL